MQTPTASGTQCPYCGLIHNVVCPRIKAIEYEGGLIKRIEFHAPEQIAFQAEVAHPGKVILPDAPATSSGALRARPA